MFMITIAKIRVNPKRSVVVTTDNKQYGCWTDKIEKFGLEQGASYNVETDTFETDNGTTLFNIISAKRVTIGAPETKPEFKSGAFRGPGPAAPQQSPAPSGGTPFRTPEQMFVGEIICAYIANGRCPPEKLVDTISYVRDAWSNHWGDSFREAAE